MLELAKLVSSWSKDSTKIGAVAVGDNKQVLSQGYNGFPRHTRDDSELYLNREEKLKRIVHAEENVVYNACLNGVSLAGSTVYVFGLPTCNHCAKALIQTGVKRVVMMHPKLEPGTPWVESFKVTSEMFTEAGVEFVSHEA